MVGGTKLLLIVNRAVIASIPPAAPNKCPIEDLVELTKSFELLLNNLAKVMRSFMINDFVDMEIPEKGWNV